MGLSPSNKSGKGRGRRFQAWDFSSPQVMPPSYLSAWSDIRIPKAASSAPKHQSNKKLFGSATKGVAFDRFNNAKEKENQTQPREKNTSGSSDLVKTASLGGSDERRDSVNTSSEAPSYGSALENPLASERKGSTLISKINAPDNEESDAKTNSSPLTLEDGSSERKERLKDATASQKQDKSTGKKKNREKGGSENVFNARSPIQEHPKTLTHDKSITPSQSHSRAKVNSSSSFSLQGSSTEATSAVRSEHGNVTPRKSSMKWLEVPGKNDPPKSIPFRSPPIAPTRNDRKDFEHTEAHQSSRGKSAAVTEAKLQANLLRKSGHREFSSHVFDMSSNDEGEHKSNESLAKGTKKNKKKGRAEDAELDPVKAEIAKQQARYNDYMNKREKKNPYRYSNGDVSIIHELTSEEESGHKHICEQKGSTDNDVVGNVTRLQTQNGTLDTVNTPRSGTRDNRDQSWSATKKDKDRRKRKRSEGDGSNQDDPDVEGSRKKSKVGSSGNNEQSGVVRQNHLSGDGHSRNNPVVRGIAKSVVGKLSPQSTAMYFEHPKPVSLQQLRNAPPMTVITENASANADFIATLKSFWDIIPKALLHTTMTNLNKANCRSLNEKLKLCQKGKQTNPHIRIVTRINENGDEVELLEEYGRISEPDPHTMSSELTLLTAAKELIVLLSGQRVGLDLSSIVSSSLEAGGKSVGAFRHGQATQGRGGEVSLLEEELSRIANEYQKEIDKLREEKRDLAAKIKKSKR